MRTAGRRGCSATGASPTDHRAGDASRRLIVLFSVPALASHRASPRHLWTCVARCATGCIQGYRPAPHRLGLVRYAGGQPYVSRGPRPATRRGPLTQDGAVGPCTRTWRMTPAPSCCLLYTSDAADEEDSV